MKINIKYRQIQSTAKDLSVFMLLIILLTALSTNVYSKSTFSSDRITSAIKNLVEEKAGNDVEIDFLTTLNTLEFNEDNIAAEIILDDVINPGNNVVGLKFSHNNRLIKYLDVKIRVKIITEVWVASRTIPANTKLSEKDFVLVRKSLGTNVRPLEINEFIGRELSRSVLRDDFITQELLASEVIIKRGDKVTIVVQSGGVRVRCAGTAVQDGSPGQNVRVKRDGSTAVLSGKVADDGTVVVNFNNLSMN